METRAPPASARSRILLVHRLQRERGATCAWVAGGGNFDTNGIRLPLQCGSGSLVADLRRRTDRSAHAEIASELSTLRAIADRGVIEPGECAKAFYATLNGFSALIANLHGEAFQNTSGVLREVAMLKELYGKQRAFLVGVGSLESRALPALPPRALMLFLKLLEDQQATLTQVKIQVDRKRRSDKGRLMAALAIDDARMAELANWLRTDEFDLAALRTRFAEGALSCEACWICWTVHIDKLQALEDDLLQEHYEALHAQKQLKAVVVAVLFAVVAVLILMSTLLFLDLISDRTLVFSVITGGGGAGLLTLQGVGASQSRSGKEGTPNSSANSSEADNASSCGAGSDKSCSCYGGSTSPSSQGSDPSRSRGPASRVGSFALDGVQNMMGGSAPGVAPPSPAPPQRPPSDSIPATLLARLRDALPEAGRALTRPRSWGGRSNSASSVGASTCFSGTDDSPRVPRRATDANGGAGGPAANGGGTTAPSNCGTSSSRSSKTPSSTHNAASEIEEDIDAFHAKLAAEGSGGSGSGNGNRSPAPRNDSEGSQSSGSQGGGGARRAASAGSESLQFNMSFTSGLANGSAQQQQQIQQAGQPGGPPQAAAEGSTSSSSNNSSPRGPRPLGLVAHRPPSGLDERPGAEALAAVWEDGKAASPNGNGYGGHGGNGHGNGGGARERGANGGGPSPTNIGSACMAPAEHASSSSNSPRTSAAPSPRASRRDASPRPQPTNAATIAAEMQALERLMDQFGEQGALDDYAELKCLGRGAFGQAVLMRSSSSGQTIVAKRLQYDGLSTSEFRLLENEVKVCAKLRHPNIAHYLGTVIKGDKLMICLEYAAGGTLADSIDRHFDRNSPFASESATIWIKQIASAVAHMHGMRILHRDLSANNVFLSATGNIKVGDFGLSKAGALGSRSASATGNRTMCGTPNYFSPEMINGEAYGTPSDTWSVGLLAYEILTLEHPFSGGSLASMLKRIASSDYDEMQLVNAPHPEHLKDVASKTQLLHPDPRQRLTLETLLAREPFASS